MIDEEWLHSLDFEGMNGLRIQGVLGIGSSKVVLRGIAPDGRALALKTEATCLGYHIGEIPLFLSDRPKYDLAQLNRKLASLLGAPDLDQMTQHYHRMYSSMLRLLYTSRDKLRQVPPEQFHLLVTGIGATLIPACPEALHFLLASPPTLRRLDEIATISNDQSHPALIEVNGPSFAIGGMAKEIAEWAEHLLLGISALPPAPFSPGTLRQNPLYVWGGAAMDAFFTDEELPSTEEFVSRALGKLTESPQVVEWLEQAVALTHAMNGFLGDKVPLDRFMKVCRAFGFWFDVYNREGKIVATSMVDDLSKR